MHITSLQAQFLIGSLNKNKYLKLGPQATGLLYLLGSRRSQFHDANSVVGSAAFLVELNVTSQSIYTDL